MTVPAAPSERTRVRRAPKRGAYDRELIDAILDEALVGHLGFAHEGQPYVIPALHARVGDEVYLHASTAARLTRVLQAGAPACLTVTLVDGLVLARSAFHHSMNYRSVVVLGRARTVVDDAERLAALEAFSEALVPGRWSQVRGPNRKEMKATQVLALRLDEASAKVRTGPPVDDDEDLAIDVWAGVVPLALRAGPPQADAHTPEGDAPAHVAGWAPTRSRGRAR